MDYPIDRIAFSKFIRHSNIFELTRVAMAQCLESWYNDESNSLMICDVLCKGWFLPPEYITAGGSFVVNVCSRKAVVNQ